MNIITLTLNPAFDLHCRADGFQPYGETVIEPQRRDAGGKGVNVSRALAAFGMSSTAYAVVGRDNRREYEGALQDAGFFFSGYPVDGRIRENITIHTAGKPETRLRFPGFSISDTTVQQIFAGIVGCGVGRDTCFVFSGSVPPGVSREGVTKQLCALRGRGVKTVIDSVFLGAKEIEAAAPYLIKPNEEEACRLFGSRPGDTDGLLDAAMRFCRRGAERILLSRGEKGAWLISASRVTEAVPPPVEALSAVGAGDSALAGFLYAMAQGKDEAECLRFSVASGTAACLSEGTLPPNPADVRRLLGKISLRAVA